MAVDSSQTHSDDPETRLRTCWDAFEFIDDLPEALAVRVEGETTESEVVTRLVLNNAQPAHGFLQSVAQVLPVAVFGDGSAKLELPFSLEKCYHLPIWQLPITPISFVDGKSVATVETAIFL